MPHTEAHLVNRLREDTQQTRIVLNRAADVLERVRRANALPEDCPAEEYDHVHNWLDEAAAQLAKQPAPTFTALLAKAAAIADWIGGDLDGPLADPQAAAMMAVLRDVMAMQPDRARERPAPSAEDAAPQGRWLAAETEETRAQVSNYFTWLALEERYLAAEFPELKGFIPMDNRAAQFHWTPFGKPEKAPPSSRAALVLEAVGIDWREDVARQARRHSDGGEANG